MDECKLEFELNKLQGKIVILKPDSKFYIQGIYQLKLLFGSLECFGHHFEKDQSKYLIFSHTSTGIFLFESKIPKEKLPLDKKKTKILEHININFEKYLIENYSTAILLEKHTFVSLGLYSNICRKFKGLGKSYPITIHHCNSGSNSGYRISKRYLHMEGWEEVARTLVSKNKNKLVKFLACGQKSAGKSTLNRFIANKFLSHNYNVYWLDCDLGQSEFTPSGCVSLVQINKAMFGPNFSHQPSNSNKSASVITSCYLGDISPARCLYNYIKAVEYVYCYFIESIVTKEVDRNKILIVNTQGWIEDVGQDVLIDTIRITKPDLILQLAHINSQSKLNISNELIYSNLGFYTEAPVFENSRVEYTVCQLMTETTMCSTESISSVSQESQWKFKPNELRLCSFMEYFFNRNDKHCRFLLPYANNIQRCVPFYKVFPIKWRDIYLSFVGGMNCFDALLECLPLKIVGLCSLNETQIKYNILKGTPASWTPVSLPKQLPYNTRIRMADYSQKMNCLGVGIIRNVDLYNECLYILTPLHPNQLACVNILVVGNCSMPHELNPQAEQLEQYPSYHGPIIKIRRNLPRHT